MKASTAARRGRWLAALCLLPFALVFFAFQIAPLLWVAVNSLQTGEGWSLANFSRILGSRFYRQAISHSLQVADWSSLFGLLIALLGSYSRSEEHTSELQSREKLVCRLLLEK